MGSIIAIIAQLKPYVQQDMALLWYCHLILSTGHLC